MKRMFILTMLAALTVTAAFAQSESSYDVGVGTQSGANDAAAPVGLLDPSRFTVNHAMSFMAGGTKASNVKSQSIYSTMMQYKFNAPVVLSLNFDMPLHSTFNQYQNLSEDNLQSYDYFRNMPVEASLSWFPAQNFMMRFSVVKMPEYGSGYYGYSRYNHWHRPMF